LTFFNHSCYNYKRLNHKEDFHNEKLFQILTVSNLGKTELQVIDIQISDNQVTVALDSFNVTFGMSQEVNVTFAPTSIGPLSAMLTIHSNDPGNGTVEIPVTTVEVRGRLGKKLSFGQKLSFLCNPVQKLTLFLLFLLIKLFFPFPFTSFEGQGQA
jgi:hypothetical protein